ncbi:hypothetical protein BTVI_29562 [Pitangus sulphuratus]|nr:hypothetical protein BTVI_29562 [Pitangus sulphuratus]
MFDEVFSLLGIVSGPESFPTLAYASMILGLGLILRYAKRHPAERFGRLKETRLNFDYKVQKTSGATLTPEGKVLATYCIGFVWQGFSSRRDYRYGFYMKLQEAFPMSSGVNGSWLQGGPLGKPISDDGSDHGITDIRRGKTPVIASREKSKNIRDEEVTLGIAPSAVLPFWCLLGTG